MAGTQPPHAVALQGAASREVSIDRKPFQETRLGRLPTELLQTITRCLDHSSLTKVARIHPELRSLAERRLYTNINLSLEVTDGRNEESNRKEFWPLQRTLSFRPDLAERVQELSMTILNQKHHIEIACIHLNKANPPMHKADLFESTIAGMILKRLPKLERLSLHLLACSSYIPEPAVPASEIDLNAPCISSLFQSALLEHAVLRLIPSFDYRTAHLINPLMFAELRELTWIGYEFHWALARSPKLRKLVFLRPCFILQDFAREETNSNLEQLCLAHRSSILVPNTEVDNQVRVAELLGHFPALENLV